MFKKNSAPEFETLIPKIIIDANDLQETNFKYESPLAQDKEKDEVIMEFSGISDLSCNCVTVEQQ